MYEDPNLNLGIAAALMGKSEQFVRVGLQQGVLPFGVAVKNKTRYSYYISPERFRAFLGITDKEYTERVRNLYEG